LIAVSATVASSRPDKSGQLPDLFRVTLRKCNKTIGHAHLDAE
jgi:hypothetical protein